MTEDSADRLLEETSELVGRVEDCRQVLQMVLDTEQLSESARGAITGCINVMATGWEKQQFTTREGVVRTVWIQP